MKRELLNVPCVQVAALENKAAACTSSGAKQIIPAISAGLIAIYLW